jgi:atypical dual specificity phosphatase
MSSTTSTTTTTPPSPPTQLDPKLSKKEQKQLKEQLKAKAKLRQRAPKYIILMGLPASGKSTFSNRLMSEWQLQIDRNQSLSNQSSGGGSNSKKFNDTFIIANQDKIGKKACIKLVSESTKKNRIIIDRCNPSAADRNEWINILNNPPPKQVALVYFTGSAESCIERARNRVGHETIPEGRGERIVNDMARRIEPPTDHEKKNVFGIVQLVHSFDECDGILRMWGC